MSGLLGPRENLVHHCRRLARSASWLHSTGKLMRLPIRNKGAEALTVWIEPWCEQYDVPVGGEAIVSLEDGEPHSIDIYEHGVTIWNEGDRATVEVLTENDQSLDHALMLVRVWLYRFGADDDATRLDQSVSALELSDGYLGARAKAFGAFYQGFQSSDPSVSIAAMEKLKNDTLIACFRVGADAAHRNRLARGEASFPGLGGLGPFDTDTARSSFERAAGVVRSLESEEAI